MPKCVTCGNEVIVGSNRTYVYVNINVGIPGKEKPLYFHFKCFAQTVKKRSKLWKEIAKAFFYLF